MDIQKTIAALEFWGGNQVDLHCGMMALNIAFGQAMIIPKRGEKETDEQWISRTKDYMLECLVTYKENKDGKDAYDVEVAKIPVPEKKMILSATTAQIEEPIKP